MQYGHIDTLDLILTCVKLLPVCRWPEHSPWWYSYIHEIPFSKRKAKIKRYYLLNFWIHFHLNWAVRFQYCPLQHKGHYRLTSFYVAYLKLSFWRSSDDNHSQLGIWSFSRGNLEWINIAFGSCLLKESFKATSSPFQSHILFKSEKLFITAAALHFSHDGLVLFKVHYLAVMKCGEIG